MSLKWYVVHVYSGHEQKVKVALEEKIQGSRHPDKFGDILIPTENVVELVDGKKKESSRKFYPGYILVRMYLDNETWHIVSSTAKVTGFLGGKNKPAPITDREAQSIIDKMETRTFTFSLSGETSSTVPLKFENGPSITLTSSPGSK